MKFIKKIFYLFLFLSIYLLIDIGRFLIYPNLKGLEEGHLEYTSFMKYRMEEAKKEGKYLDIKNEWVSLEEISPYIIKGVLISEDDKFWRHNGFDLEGIKYALKKDIEEGKMSSGGSTISQQLTKNLFLDPSKNPIRKLKETILTWRLEKSLKKSRILELYLNSAEWGEGIFGIEEAAKFYFHKKASKLTAKESSRLIAVLPNPIIYDPIGNQEFVIKRAYKIYKVLKRRGIINKYDFVISERNKETHENEKKLEQEENKGILDSINVNNLLENKVIEHKNELETYIPNNIEKNNNIEMNNQIQNIEEQ